ncbi:MAG TPA: winged helix DNA-binding domain-containing protein [Blastocatellia bacterium]|nr:winged helix DNA-binding domain-containing protein [Blastocatellia bacterium]
MTISDIARLRLHNQRISASMFRRPADAVAWLGAVQAQDYLGALWAVGLRLRNAVEADIEQALADRKIIRTWPMRGTLHFVAAADARWMLELLTPRIVANIAQTFLRQFDLDERAFARSKELFVRALQGGKRLARTAMYKVLEEGGVSTAGQRGRHILWRMAQDGVICFGSREGRQQTFALLDEWAPKAKRLSRDESLAEITKRYFTSRGPATLQDFMWWSGLTKADASAGLEMAKRSLVRETFNGQPYWLASSTPETKDPPPSAYLLPAFDEYTVAYKDRGAVLDPAYTKQANPGNGVLSPVIVIGGRVVGTWKRTLKKDSLAISQSHFAKLKRIEAQAITEAASRYGKFLGASLILA